MSMLSRYHKSGGFIQLLQLIETCGKQKQDNFLQMIEGEDPRWSSALREKMLSVEKVLTWPDFVLAEIAVRVQPLTLGTAFHGFKPEDCERFLKTFSHTQKRVIEDVIKTKQPTTAEVNSAIMKMLIEIRSMISNGYIRFEKFGHDMVIPEDFEEKLGKSPMGGSSDSPQEIPNMDAAGASAPYGQGTHQSPSGNKGADVELNSMRSKLHAVSHENNQLKTEVKILRDKLAQIKKIA